jgi:cbb3-type cytochrome oxidase maturation protein
MMWSMLLLIFLTLAAGFAGWMFFLWAVKSGQYDDIEGPKYRMLEDDEEDVKKTEQQNDKQQNTQDNKPD